MLLCKRSEVTPEVVIKFYRQLLGREPENQAIINDKVKNFKTIKSLLDAFTNSDEFKTIMQSKQNYYFSQCLLKADGILTTHNNISLIFPAHDRVQLQHNLIAGDHFQQAELKTAFTYLRNKKLLKKGVFIDIGANVGAHTVYSFQEPEITEAISIEPSASNVFFIKQNLKLNNLDNKVRVFQQALGDINGEIKLSLNPTNCGDYRLESRQNNGENFFNEEQFNDEIVPISTLDSFIDSAHLDPNSISLIWIDTQGSEGLILGPSQKIKQSTCPLYIEFWPYGMSKLNSYSLLREFIIQEVKLIVRFIDGKIINYPPQDIDKLYEEFAGGQEYCDLLLIRES